MYYDDVYVGIFGRTEDELMHYGKGHDDNPPTVGSGRYAWGSGKNPHQHDDSLQARINAYKAANPNMSEAEVAKNFGFYKTTYKGDVVLDKEGKPQGSVDAMRAAIGIEENKRRKDHEQQSRELWSQLDDEGKHVYAKTEIARMLGISEGAVRKYILQENQNTNAKFDAVEKLKAAVKDVHYLDLGPGTARELGLTETAFKQVVEMLKQEGYITDKVRVRDQIANNGQQTTYLVLCEPGTEFKEAQKNLDKIRSLADLGEKYDITLERDGKLPFEPVDISRVEVKYADYGGKYKDGLVEIRGVLNPDGTVSAANPDLSLGESRYAQVRIAVSENGETKYYIKGMAAYNPNLPEGTDILVNSNKTVSQGIEKALKPIERDKYGNIIEDLPFGSTVYQTHYTDPETGETKTSAINIVGYGPDDGHKEGAWGDWGSSRSISAQMLSKQDVNLAKQQLRLAIEEKQREFDEIKKLTHPYIRQKCLDDFSEVCDKAAVDLKAHSVPGQMTHVLLPVPELKDNEIYAPNYDPGTIVALIRYPHGGPFEIPILKVVGDKPGTEFMKGARDAVGINPTNLAILSGADCDGDTATVMPVAKPDGTVITKIKGYNGDAFSVAVGQKLKGFEPSEAFPGNGKPTITEQHKNKMMGVGTNLIVDMWAQNCQDPDEMARAIKYSMVIVDSYKHKLPYKEAAKDLDIQGLKEKYQRNYDPVTGELKIGGASSLLSRSKSEVDVPKRSLQKGKIDPETGEREDNTLPEYKRVYEKRDRVKVLAPADYKEPVIDKETGEPKLNKDGSVRMHHPKYLKDEKGEYVYEKDPRDPEGKRDLYVNTGVQGWRTTKSTRMAEAKDASELLSNGERSSPIELAYRDYANAMKQMARDARKEEAATPNYTMDPKAKREYAAEVASLEEKLKVVESNSLRERAARRLATQIGRTMIGGMADPSDEDKKKANTQALKIARQRTGAQRQEIEFTDREWEAVQHHALAADKLAKIIEKADPVDYKSRAMPKSNGLSDSTIVYIQHLLDAHCSTREIKELTDVSVKTINKIANGSIVVKGE